MSEQPANVVAIHSPRRAAGSNGSNGNGKDARLAVVETRMSTVESRLEKVDARLAAVEDRLARVETRLDSLATKEDIQKMKVWILSSILGAAAAWVGGLLFLVFRLTGTG